jgi:hypothetical protein
MRIMKRVTVFFILFCWSLSLHAQIGVNARWTWINGEKRAPPAPYFGTMGVSNDSNLLGGRTQGVQWTDANGNFWAFGGMSYTTNILGSEELGNDLWKYDLLTNQWTWIKGDNVTNKNGVYGTQGIAASANKPGGRYRSVSGSDGSGRFWLFGGSGYAVSGSSGSLNDLWRYDPLTDQWTWIKGDNTINQNGIYGTQGLPDATNKPGGRYGSVSWVDGSGNFWLFGGTGYAASGSIGGLNDLWKYDPLTNQWTWIKGDNTLNQTGVYGTQGVSAASNKPGYRKDAVGWADGSGNLWLFGGDYMNDLWKYNILSNEILLLLHPVEYMGSRGCLHLRIRPAPGMEVPVGWMLPEIFGYSGEIAGLVPESDG